MNIALIRTLLATLWLATPWASAAELPLLHPLFDDHAVLQRDKQIPIRGWAAPGDSVSIALAHAKAVARADANGRWSVMLPAMPAGGPHELVVHTASASRTVRDMLIGDVWLCSGQSNMVLQVHRTLDSRAEIAGANNDSIRMLTLALASSATPLEIFESPVQWRPTTPATVPEFSATCYYFAREFQKITRVPMGLINSAWGSSNIQTWMSREALRPLGDYDELLALLDLHKADPVAAERRWGELWEAWWRKRVPTAAGSEPWREASAADRNWRRAPSLDDAWESWGLPELANFDGMVWYRTTVQLTVRQAAQASILTLGAIDEVDETWVNGRPVGSTSGADVDRRYTLPPQLLRAGENTIVINALDTYGRGGFYGPAEKRALHFADGSSIALDAPWFYQIAPHIPGRAPRAPWEPVRGLALIYNAMIAPLVPSSLRGVVWYQGESNTDDAARYSRLLKGLMTDWRGKFGADLPFLVVQLANYGAATTAPYDSGSAQLREAQRLTVAGDAHAGLAVTIDIGDRYDIHPANKQEVGRRLARAARRVVNGEAIAPSGPAPLNARHDGNQVVVTFGDVEGELLVYGAKEPIGFELCGAEQSSCRYVEARAQARSVALEIADATKPTRVRFCWADSPVCNLYDRSGLPAGPFEIAIDRTD